MQIDSKEYKDAIDALIHKHAILVEQLTEAQLAEAIKQAIACGDFIKHVRITDGAQCIVYIPYAREQELEGKIKDLREEIENLNNAITEM